MKPAQMVAIMLMVLLVIYPLSPGLVGLYYQRLRPNDPVPKALEPLYAPIGWICEHSDTINQAYMWYFNLLGVK